MSVTTRLTGRIEVRGSVHSSTIFGRPPGVMDHGDDDASGTGDQVHGPAHSGNECAGNHPVGQPTPGVDLQSAEYGQVEVTAANQAERESAVEAGCSGNGRDESSPGIHEVRVLQSLEGRGPTPARPFSVWKKTVIPGGR